MLGCADAGFAAIQAIALNAAIKGSILAVPDARLVMMMALPLGSTRALLALGLDRYETRDHGSCTDNAGCTVAVGLSSMARCQPVGSIGRANKAARRICSRPGV
jgi:hypothetical protein